MKFFHDHTHRHYLSGLPQLDRIEQKIDLLLKQGELNMASIKDIQAAVAEETTLIGAISDLVAGLKQRLIDIGVAQADIDAAFTGLTANSAAMRAITEAVVANTPAADVPVDQPPPA
jgi:hypothetical protein